ncbi:MAG: TetR/AcrR family transcriptional regulator [Firmicutes bacterium]|nr:TetR/AcrR family transcriptional regulator [Bacillota bacterium]
MKSKQMTGRQRQALETKSRIRKAALELFDRNGFDNVSMEDIAEASGCSVGNIYHYFQGKSDLVGAVTDNVDASYRGLEERYLARLEAGEDAVSLMTEFMGDALMTDCGEELLFRCFIHSLEYPEQGTLVLDPESKYMRILKALSEGIAGSHTLREGFDEDTLSWDFMVINRGILLQWRIEGGGFDAEVKGKAMIGAYLKGAIIDEQ